MNSGLQDALKSFEQKQRIVGVLVLLFMIGLSVIYTYLYRSGQAAESARLITRMLHIQDRREAILTLQSARLDHFRVIRFSSAEPDKSFTLPELADLMPASSPWHSFMYHTVTIPVEIPGQKPAELSFEFGRFAYVPWAILISLVVNLLSLPQIHLMRKRIAAQYEKDLELDKQSSRLEIANIVRHNIRTPLSALMRLSDTVNFRNEKEAEVFQSIIEQVRSLVSKLDVASPTSKETIRDGFFETVQAAIQESRAGLDPALRFEVDLDDSLPSVFVPFAEAELKSVIGNLVNNAVEALRGPGTIHLRARDLGHSVVLEIEDDGPGIPAHLLASVMKKGFTFGKPNGTGIGLFHASQCAREWGGELRIRSTPGVGTTVEIQLPIQGRHSWYTPRIKLEKNSTVIVVDDQISVHRLWKMRLDEAGFAGKVFFFLGARELRDGIDGMELNGVNFLMDHDLLDSGTTGLDLLKEVPAGAHRYLVTNRFDDSSVRGACEREGLALIPKTSLHLLPLVLTSFEP